ncbi:helix-turn-helix domain-containing protein [Bartonella sp. F02]|uniref:helix-turn-helix domain-containing protein n=1 Tax=Bartonella sp. F02 TaxID=2967262 RepID=UPI0022A989CB|nr:helix-turn-helix domain-containing protein [Bartonella sp. F02]MCZ2328951.1 helix-turn-helix domain-containing protein [Bartonella sp. F02]
MRIDESVYVFIFLKNVLRILKERRMTKTMLAKKSGISIAFISEITTGKANPSLHVMEAIAIALETPLSLLLESTNLDQSTLGVLTRKKLPDNSPPGYERVYVTLPQHRAFLVKKWGEEAKKKLQDKI